jgi:hypothetical protein
VSRQSPLLREQAAEPGRFWVRHAPRRWPSPASLWTDLAAGTLGGEAEPDPGALVALRSARLEDTLYLPPVPRELAPQRDALAATHAARGTPVLVQLLPGDPPPAVDAPVRIVWDLLPLALGRQGAVGPGEAAAWPLLPGGAVANELASLAESVAAAGIGALQGVALELEPHQRRRLGAELSERRYLELFHGTPLGAAALVRAAWSAGLEPLMTRPLPRPPLRATGNLGLAGELAALGELCLRLGEPEPRGQALLRAARFVERAPHELAALARDGNLGVLPWLEGEARRVVEELLGGSEPVLRGELRGAAAAARG